MIARILCAALLSVLVCGTALADDLTPEKRQDIQRYLELSGTRNMARQTLQLYAKQSMSLVKKLRPDIPASSLPTVEREISAFIAEKINAPGGLMEQLVPICAKHFSHDEIRQLVAFYESPAGRKAVAVLPQVMREGTDAAQRLGISMLPEINGRITEALRREQAEKAKTAPM